MERNADPAWMRGGAALSLGLAALLYAFRRRAAGRAALGLAVAFLERVREARLAARVHALLSRAPQAGSGRSA